MSEILDETSPNQNPAILWKPCLIVQGIGFLLAFMVLLLNAGSEGALMASFVILGLCVVNFVTAILLFIIKRKEHGFAFLIMWAVMGLVGFSACLGSFTLANPMYK